MKLEKKLNNIWIDKQYNLYIYQYLICCDLMSNEKYKGYWFLAKIGNTYQANLYYNFNIFGVETFTKMFYKTCTIK